MWALWYVTFGLLAIAVLSGIACIICVKKEKYWKKRWDRAYPGDKDYEVVCNKYNFWTDSVGVPTIVLIAGCFFGFICLMVSITEPIKCKKEIAYFQQQKTYIQYVIENGTDLENIAISQTLIEQNSWLAEAKAELGMFGAWSKYYGSGLEDLEPIVVER